MAAVLVVACGVAEARDIDLVTLPPRDGVQLTIYNSEDLTLVKEVRSITFRIGVNRLQSSWANTLIDPTSVYLRPLEHADQIDVSDTTFPADRPQVLIWSVESQFEGQVKVEVSYFTSGISWNADYVVVTDAGEALASVDGYVTVVNGSGEDYEGAEVRLVVGVVNLVEKIAQLAQGPKPRDESDRKAKQEMLQTALKRAEARDGAADAPIGQAGAERASQIIKEGLSEYFIFTVEGEQTIRNGWSQRMISFRARGVPFDVVYRYRAHQYGERPARFFILANDEEHKMGTSPLPDGVIRVFRENGRDGLNFFVAQATKYIPIRERIELNVGPDDQLVYERVVLDVGRKNFLYDEKQTPPAVNGWDEGRTWQEEVRNYRAKAVKVEIRHVLEGDCEFGAEGVGELKLYDYRTPEYVMTVPARGKQKWTSDGLFHLGVNQKQNRVRLK